MKWNLLLNASPSSPSLLRGSVIITGRELHFRLMGSLCSWHRLCPHASGPSAVRAHLLQVRCHAQGSTCVPSLALPGCCQSSYCPPGLVAGNAWGFCPIGAASAKDCQMWGDTVQPPFPSSSSEGWPVCSSAGLRHSATCVTSFPLCPLSMGFP